VFVIGAGPAGLFAARKIATAGHQVVIFNRDIKPGGLAEYGIYPQKFRMKAGLRKQFTRILDMPNVAYFGGVPVGESAPLPLGEVRQWNPAAMIFAVGAQGTKKLGLPGEDAKGVYSAKDFVFFYNQLPPFASQDFSTGRRVAIVGMGNVMVDIARWLLQDMPGKKPEEVVVIARRGPFEVKFDEKEFDHIEMHLDRKGMQDEMDRIAERIKACGQDMSKVPDTTFPWLKKPASQQVDGRITFRLLTSPSAIKVDEKGRICKLTVIENTLVPKGDTTASKFTDQTIDLEFDTMIFAIGDVVDPTLGLPYEKGGYLTNPDSSNPERAAYEVFDPQAKEVLEGHYAVGWARKASEGLVGKARYDAEKGCNPVVKYLDSASGRKSATLDDVAGVLKRKGIPLVTKKEISLLARAEEARAKAANLPAFKFSTNEEMLAAIESARESAGGSGRAAQKGSEAA
jgi:ferredoxin--NADP+ reductase